jgi:DNA-binding NarL/FixJ family response regulator
MRIFMADDSPLFRIGVREVLQRELAEASIAEASDFNDMLGQLRLRRYDVLIMDISMPGMSGLAAIKQVKYEFPTLPVVILTVHPEEQYAVRMFKAGADAYLNKATDPETLACAVRTVVSGRKYVGDAGEILALSVGSNQRPSYELLSDREYEVLCLMGAGKTVKEIAEATHLSMTTVSTYRSRLLEKLGLRTTAELIRYAIEHLLKI